MFFFWVDGKITFIINIAGTVFDYGVMSSGKIHTGTDPEIYQSRGQIVLIKNIN